MKSERHIGLNSQEVAKKVLLQESQAIAKVAQLIDLSFEKCVQSILQATGRVVITGIGKSALIGQKIVATLNSTGTPALFMHAADAIHGDLGMIQPHDVVICISKSGDTPEVKVLVPLLKRQGVVLIALVSNVHSYLAQKADYILPAHVECEADPLDLAPTTSTTVALAMGDALAICLLQARGFTRQDFARFHPGGALGKKLYLKVSDIYPQNALPVVQAGASIKEVILEMTTKRLGATAVVEADQTLAGIITDGDLRRMLNLHDDPRLLLASNIMTRQPTGIIAPTEYATNALEMMQTKNISQLVVVENKKPLGFVHLHDLLKEGLV